MNKKKSGKLLLFDHDGVIADSFPQSAKAVIAVSKKYKLPIYTPEQVKKMFNHNFFESMKSLGMSEQQSHDFMNDEFWDTVIHTVNPFKNMDKVIERLSRKHTLVVITSAGIEWAESVYKRYNMTNYFADIVSRESGLGKVVKIQNAMKKYKFPKEQTYYIGDTMGDVAEGKKAGVRTVGVTWGFHTKEAIQKANPDYVVDTTKELEDLLI